MLVGSEDAVDPGGPRNFGWRYRWPSGKNYICIAFLNVIAFFFFSFFYYQFLFSVLAFLFGLLNIGILL